MKDTLETVLQGGALGLLGLMLVCAAYIAVYLAPSLRGYFDGHTTTLNTIATRLAVVDTKVDAVHQATSEHDERLRQLADTVRDEAAVTRDNIAACERRVTAAVRREQASDPPPLSRPPALAQAGPRQRMTG